MGSPIVASTALSFVNWLHSAVSMSVWVIKLIMQDERKLSEKKNTK